MTARKANSKIKSRRETQQDLVLKRVDYVRELLGKRYTKEAIKREVRRKFKHHFDASTIQGYIRQAQDETLEELAKARKEQRAESLQTYYSIISDSKATPKDRVLAQRAIDELLGLRIHLPPLEKMREYLGLSDAATTRGHSGNVPDDPRQTEDGSGDGSEERGP